jgi:hypothetical protein
MSKKIDDWLSRVNIPDIYPREQDPFKPSVGYAPTDGPAASILSADLLVSGNVWDGWLTNPGTRPIVYQRALSFQVTANTVPVPLTNGAFQCETILLDVLSTAANSVFFGYGGGITPTSGIEIRAGLPIVLTTENGREQWELQRVLEAIAGMIAAERGYNALGPYRAPRVIFNSNEYFLVATAATTVRVMLFMTAEYQ